MKPERLVVSVALLALTAVSFFHFPGHTWLQSDTQIYTAILEHLADPGVLAKDLVATRPHVSYTIYDETALLLRKLTGLGFREILGAEQFVFRLVGLTGVYFLAAALGLTAWPAILVTGCFALGAVINGPAVLLFEYEPVPRGFAVPLIFFSLGLAAHRNWIFAGCAGALAFLYHPPTAAALWLVAGVYWVVSHRDKRPAQILIPAAISIGVLLLLSQWQTGEREAQQFLGRIEPALEKLQRMRGAYNWIELWPRDWLWQYPLLFVILSVAWWRTQSTMTAPLRWFTLGMPICGLLSIPVTWVLLDQMKLSLIPQFQPARAVLFITAFVLLLGAVAGYQAARDGRWLEGFAWFVVVFALPANGLLLALFNVTDPVMLRRLAVVAGLAVVTVLLCRRSELVLVAAFLPFVVIPSLGGVRNSPQLHTPEIAQLSDWARQATQPGHVFLFAGFGRDLAPGIFRVNALRPLFVDWKGGGQVNLLPEFAEDWWQRWQAARQGAWQAGDELRYRQLGIRWLVLPPPAAGPEGVSRAYENTKYAVYDLSARNASTSTRLGAED